MSAERASWGRRIGIAVLVLIATAFSFLNAGERVSLNLGFTILYRISLVGLLLAVFLFGMITMFLFGLRQDRKIRAMLRDRALQAGFPPSTIKHPPPDDL